MSWISKEIGWLKSRLIYQWLPWKAARKRALFGSIIEKGDLCFDIGAHLGDRTTTFCDLGASVIAVEPQPRFARYLDKAFGNNDKVIIEKVAIGDSEGMAKFFISNDHPTLSTMSGQDWQTNMDAVASYDVKFDETIDVEVTTINGLMKKYGVPKFIKIDIEGFEINALEGMDQCSDYISIEFLSFDMDRLVTCMERLEEMGYRSFNWSYKETFRWSLDVWSSAAEVKSHILARGNEVFSGDIYARIDK